MQRGSNLERLGDYNQAVILEGIRLAPEGISRVELAEETKLSPQTVSNVVRRLLDDGMVREDRTIINGPGKPRTVLQLENNRLLGVGIHLDPGVMTLVVVNLAGEKVAEVSRPLPSGSQNEIIREITDAVNVLIRTNRHKRANYVGVGIAAPGPIDATNGRLINPPLLDEWKNIELVTPLSKSLRMPVTLSKDTVAMTIAEQWIGGGQGHNNFVFAYVGSGVGVGMVIDGQVVHGVSGNAGEFGHFVAGETGVECKVCGREDCVASTLNPKYLLQQAHEAGVDFGMTEAEIEADPSAALGLMATKARDGDKGASQVVLMVAQRLGAAIGTLVSILDLDTVFVGGHTWNDVSELALDLVSDVINRNHLGAGSHTVTVRNTALGTSVGAMGGACVILDSHISPRASSLLLR